MPTKQKEQPGKASGSKRRVRKADPLALTVVLILDESSSMNPWRDALIEGVNEYLTGLREQEGETRVSVFKFADRPKPISVAEPIETLPGFTRETYAPLGNTALWDTIALAAQETNAKLVKEGRADEKVLVATFTDGEENASVEYGRYNDGQARLASLVREFEGTGRWTFTLFGFGHTEAQATATLRGFGSIGDNAVYPSMSAGGVSKTYSGLVNATATLRSNTAGRTDSFFKDAGQTADSYLDDKAGTAAGNAAADVKVTGYTSGSLSDALGGGE